MRTRLWKGEALRNHKIRLLSKLCKRIKFNHKLNHLTQISKLGVRQTSGLFLTQGCPVCDRPTPRTFCPDCQQQLFSQIEQDQAHQPLLNNLSNHPPLAPNQWLGTNQSVELPLPVVALGIYGGTLKRAILAMKYGNRPEVARPLGTALGQRWQQCLARNKTNWRTAQPTRPPKIQSQINNLKTSSLKQGRPTTQPPGKPQPKIYAVPIPLSAGRYQQRGYNQAELIAQAFCQISQLPLLANGLSRVQETLPQHQLNPAERTKNLKDAFQIEESLHRAIHLAKQQQQPTPAVLLIDDIYTTGTTARSAAITLMQAGVSITGILTVARAIA